MTEKQCAQNANQKALLSFYLHSWLEQLSDHKIPSYIQTYEHFLLNNMSVIMVIAVVNREIPLQWANTDIRSRWTNLLQK